MSNGINCWHLAGSCKVYMFLGLWKGWGLKFEDEVVSNVPAILYLLCLETLELTTHH